MDTNNTHIILYLENKLSKDELLAFEDQLSADADLRKEVEDMRFLWEMSGKLKLQKQIDTDGNWKTLSRRITWEEYRKKIGRFTRTAAAILLLPVLIAALSLYHSLKERDNQPIQQVELTTAYGLISKVTLPDGSEVWLNSGSHLSYPQRFTGNTRTVRLTGEAYFKVTSDPNNRFDVTTPDGLLVSAYGTEFNVNAYTDDKWIEATLAKGNIEVSLTNHPDLSKKIQPGQQVSFDKSNNQMDVANVNLSVETAWKDGKMIFRRASMHEIVQRLSRHFNVDIQLKGKTIHDYEYSATFTTESLEEVLQLLKISAPIQYKIIDPKQTQDYAFTKRTILIQAKD